MTMARGVAAALAVLFIISGSAAWAENAPAAIPESPPLLVIDFGSLPPDCVRLLEERGFDVVALLPPTSVLVRPPADVRLIASLPAPAAVSPLQPQEKLSGQLPAFFGGAGNHLVTVLFDGAREQFEMRLESLGFEARGWDRGSVKVDTTLSDIPVLASQGEVYWIEPAPQPMPMNDKACRRLGARQASDGAFQNDGNALWSYDAATGAFEGLTGAGVNVSIADSGIDGTHPAFNGRKVAYLNYAGTGDWTDQGDPESGHGTMCAGIVAGNGSWRSTDPSGQPGKYAGMAPGAGLIGQAIFQGGTPSWRVLCMDAYTRGAQVQSNSWGYYQSAGNYYSLCADYDAAVRDADPGTAGDQPLTVVFSAGNDGPTSMTVDAPSTAKNVITVGAIGNDKAGSAWGAVSSNTMVDFSSRGPCADGRLKPDLCAQGVDAYTTSALYNAFKDPYYNYLGRVPDDPDSSSYFAGGGTSSACPYVAGASALVIAYWRDNHGTDPSPALVKALLINGAEPLPAYPYPGNDQGWGRVNVTRSVRPATGRNIVTADQLVPLGTSETEAMLLNVSGPGELKVSLVWTDKPGSPGARRELVNDLDLEVTDPDGNLFHGNRFANGQSVAGGDPDSVNNVEGLLLSAPKAGRWRVNVTGADVLDGPQDYALVISGPVAVITADPAAVSLSFSPQSPVEGDRISMNFTVRNNGTGPAAGFPFTIAVDGTPFLEGPLPDLAAGQSTVLEANWTAVRGDHVLALAINPLGTVDELDGGNDRLQGRVTVLHYGVIATATPGSLLLDPGSTGTFEGVVTNSGTAPDTISLNFTADSPAWNASAEPAEVSLAPNGTAGVILNVTCPALALAGEAANLTFCAMSLGNATCAGSVALRAVTRQIFAVRLSQSPAQQVYPWETAEINLTVTNPGNGRDAMILSFDGEPEGWQVDLSVAALPLEARSEGPVNVRIKPPATSLAGNSSAVNLTATSQGNRSASTVLFVMVKQFYDLGLNFVLLDNSCRPGERAEAIYFVRNTGNGPDLFEAGLSAEPGWEGVFDRSMQLAGYTTGGANLSVRVPPDALTGDYQIYFYVRSSGGPVRFANFSLHVEQVFGVAAAAAPERQVIYQGEPVSLLVSVTNMGNGNDSFDIVPEGVPSPASVSGITRPLPLGPGATSSALLSISDMKAPGRYNLTFRAASRLSPVTINYSNMGILVLAIPQPPAPPPGNILFAKNPTVVSGSELCGVAVLLTAALTSMMVMKRWRALGRQRPPGAARPAYQPLPVRLRNA